MAANNIYIAAQFNAQGAQTGVNALNAALAQTGVAAQKSSQQAAAATSSLTVSIQQTTSAFGELTGAIAGLGVGRMIASMIQISAELGRAEQAMTAFAGSAQLAHEVIEQIRAVAAQGVFSFKDLEESGRRLMAFGADAKEVPMMLKIISDQATQMGGSIEDVNSIIMIFARIMGKDFVGSMDLVRKLPAEGAKVMDALKDAIKAQTGQVVVSTDEVRKAMKAGVLDPAQTWRAVLDGMQKQSGGAGARINDAAKSFKNLKDMAIEAAKNLGGEQGFGKQLSKLAQEVADILAPVAALVGWLMKLDDPTKQMIVNFAAGTAAVVAFAGAWKLFTGISGPAIEAIWGITKALAAGLVAVLTNPQLLIAMGTITAFVIGFTQLYPEKTKQLTDAAKKWVGDLWQSMKGTLADLAKSAGIDVPAIANLFGLGKKGDVLKEAGFDEVKKQVTEWGANASRTLLEALSSPAEAVTVKYHDLFQKLDELIKEHQLTQEHADDMRRQLSAARDLEMDAKLFDKEKQTIEQRNKLEAEKAKGSYEAQIAYIEALDAQDLRGKVAGIDRITQLRIQQAQAVAAIEDKQAEELFEAQQRYYTAHAEEFKAAGIDVDKAVADRHKEMVDKQTAIDQKAMDEGQKYRLEGWKKANDVIIEDQKRVFEAFHSMFDEIFDALMDRSKSLGDVFKRLVMGEVKNFLASTAAAGATEMAGYGRPDAQITRGGGILGVLMQRGMPPRAPGAPPEAYNPQIGGNSGIVAAATKLDESSDTFALATTRFAIAAERFANAAGQQGMSVQSAAWMTPRSTRVLPAVGSFGLTGEGGDIFGSASAATGVDVDLLRAVAKAESSNRPGAVSGKGAMGLMQLMPGTASDMGVTDPFNPQQNVMGGAKYLGLLLDRYGGDVPSALAAYNMGMGAYERAQRTNQPLPAETQAYVDRVTGYMGGGADLTGAMYGPPATRVYMPPSTEAPPSLPPVAPAYPPTPPEVGSLTTLADPAVIAMAKQQGVLGQVGNVAMAGAGTLAGGTKPGQLSSLLNLANLKDMFGLGHGASFGSIITSKGVRNLSTMAGLMIATKGLQQRNTFATALGGGVAGIGLTGTKLPGGYQMGLLGGVMTGVGAGIFARGIQQGGGAGFGMDVAGGAIAGAGIGMAYGPMGMLIGAGIGAAVGAIAGTIRLFVKTETERIRAMIKQIYGIDISDVKILAQIKEIVDTKYGGSVSVGVHSQEVQDLVRLYALSTGQAANMPRQMYAATIAQSTQGMQLQPVYNGGVQVQNPYTGVTSYQYQTAVATATGLNAGTTLGVPGASGIINNQWQQLTLATIRGNPSAIAQANAAAASAGDSRLTTTAAMQEPLTALS